MKEAALDFARRHELPPPSWWTDAWRGLGLEAKPLTPTQEDASVLQIPNPGLGHVQLFQDLLVMLTLEGGRTGSSGVLSG